MSAKINITVDVPEELLFAANISEDTVFECYFEDGKIHISSLSDDELAELTDLSDCDCCQSYCKRLGVCMCGMVEKDEK